jgi:hypothetical protein
MPDQKEVESGIALGKRARKAARPTLIYEAVRSVIHTPPQKSGQDFAASQVFYVTIRR